MTSAIILAGGLGTRLRGAVPDLPKPMALIHDRPFLEYQIDYWIAQGIDHFVLSVGYKYPIIMAHFNDHYREARIEYAIETTPKGTGGGLLCAIEKLNPTAPFLVVNGDTFFAVPLADLKTFHSAHHSQWTMALFKADLPNRYGKIPCAADGRVETLSLEKANIGDTANGGVYLMNPYIFMPQPQSVGISLEDMLLPQFLAQGGRCYGMVCTEQFIDIGTPVDYARAADMLKKN